VLLVLLVLLVLSGPALGAQASGALTLGRAIELSVTAGPAAQAAAGRRASIVGSARADAQWANPTVEIRRENEGAPIPYDDFVTVTLPVSFSARRSALRGALGAARARGTADSLAVIRGAQFATARAWWEAWVAGELQAFTAAQAAHFGELARYDSLRAAEGEASGAAALRTRLEAERARYAAAQAAGAAARAQAVLATLVGAAGAGPLALDTAGAGATDPLPSPADVEARALADRPDVASARAAAREAERRRAAERRGTLPDIGLSGGYKGTGGYATGQFGVVLTPPLLNLNGGHRERATGEWMMADAERRATELRAAHEARAALAAAQALDAGTAALDAAFAARADTVASAAEAAYREGAATLTELLEAHRARAEARAAGVRAVADRALARLDLKRALGASPLEP
jgi:outer membrane protein TolC